MKNMNKEELHSIFRGIANKKEEEFNQLYKKYNKLIYAIAFSILKNRENSEDMVQIVLVKIWNMKKDNLPTNNEATWLYSLTKNETLNFLRKQKNTINIDELYYISDEDKKIKEIIEKDTYHKILMRLDKEEQEIISLKILSNLTFKEISQLLNIPIGTVQWRYYKSLHTLKTLLSSLSMYIVTMTVWITQKFAKKSRIKKQESIKEETPNIENEEEKQQELTETKDEEQKKQESINKDEMETIIVEKEDICTNTQEETMEKQEEMPNLTLVDIGLLSLSSIFLIITIIFLVFFIKHQQKAKRKVSK